jgi:hypothetical protein
VPWAGQSSSQDTFRALPPVIAMEALRDRTRLALPAQEQRRDAGHQRRDDRRGRRPAPPAALVDLVEDVAPVALDGVAVEPSSGTACELVAPD